MKYERKGGSEGKERSATVFNFSCITLYSVRIIIYFFSDSKEVQTATLRVPVFLSLGKAA